MSDPTLLSAAELVRRYRSGELSPVEVLQRTFDRIDALNDELLIFTWQDRQRALADAAEAERRYRAGEDTLALLGVPFSVKEQIPVAGQPQGFGSKLFKEHRASADDPSVQRLRGAGAILLGGTNMPEFGTSATCSNPVFGTSRNPWDASRTPGGSSGGAAAAVAAGLGVIALGTDIAGSVRIPASCCGVVGIKATLGAIPQVHAADLFNALGHLGPLTRSVEDAALALELLIGPDPRDPWSLGLAKHNLRDAARADSDLRGLRIGWLPQVGLGLPDAQVLAACSAAAEKLRGAGAEVIEVSLDLSDSGQTFANIVLPLKRHFLGDRYPAEAEQLSPNFRGWLESSYPKLDAEILLATQFARSRLFHRVQAAFEQVDVLLTPTLSTPPVAADGPAELDWIHYLHPFNLSGHPAFSLPAGLSTEGWPVGLQLVGPWHSEAQLLRLAAHWQALNPLEFTDTAMKSPEKHFLPSFLLLALVSGSTIGMAKIVITLYALSLGASSLEIGIISAMEALGMIVLTLPAGFIIARYGARVVYFLSSLGPMLVNLLIPLYAVWWWLALSQLLIGLFIPFRIVAMNGVFLRHLPRIGMGKAGWYRGSLTLGMGLVGPLLGNILSERGLYHAAFVLIAGSFALMAFYSLRFWEGDNARENDENDSTDNMLAQTRGLLGNQTVAQSCLVELLNAATASLFTTFIILLALELGLSQTQAVSLVMFEALCVVLTLFLFGRLLRNQSPAQSYLAGLLLAVVSLVLCASANSYVQLLAAALLLSLATASIHLVNMARLSQRSEDKSKISGLFNLASMTGSFGGALLGGAISHFSGLANLFLLWIPLLLISALLLSRQRTTRVEVTS